VRTPIGSFGGALAAVPAVELATTVVRETLARTRVAPEEVDEVILGQVLQAGVGLNAARQAALRSGMPESTPAYTVNKVCASGMKAVALAVQAVASGESRIVLAGGTENMSAAPFLLPRARWGYRLGDGELLDSLWSEALTDPLEHCHMGLTAENLAADFAISRRDQDAFAARSQQKAAAAVAEGRFTREIVPVSAPARKGPPVTVTTDEFPRPDTTAGTLARLKPAFKPDGTVTAGNASGINDGAAAMLVLSAAEAERRGIEPMGVVLSWAAAGVDPTRMGIGPVPATLAALERNGLTLDDIDVVELNEAFAAQSLAVLRKLDLDEEKVNLNGGAIALGHPVGASGARILVTLLHLMREREGARGLATLCVGGGQGLALVLRKP